MRVTGDSGGGSLGGGVAVDANEDDAESAAFQAQRDFVAPLFSVGGHVVDLIETDVASREKGNGTVAPMNALAIGMNIGVVEAESGGDIKHHG